MHECELNAGGETTWKQCNSFSVPDSETTEVKKTYRGRCHCGKVRFEVDTDLDHVRICDCSICRRRGALNHRVDEADLRVMTPLAELTVYQWNTRIAKDYFCPVCGILPFRRPRTAPDKWTVNVRCLEGVDLDAIPVKRVHGSELSLVTTPDEGCAR